MHPVYDAELSSRIEDTSRHALRHLGIGRNFAAAVFAIGTVASGLLVQMGPVDAVPSFARQTGYSCSTCHTAQPELTPFGRQFKLNGYTSGGSRCGDISKIFGTRDTSQQFSGANASGWVLPVFQHTAKDAPQPVAPGYGYNNILDFADASVLFAGQIYCNLGTFTQVSYNHNSNTVFLDNTELRYADRARVGGNDVVWGVFGNNNPTMQDVWNTVPAWSFPWVPQDIAPAPAAATMVEGTFGQRAGGAGAYVWINNMVYAELSAYRAFDPRFLKATGSDPTDTTPRFDGFAPYWRVAIERTLPEHSFQVGTYGMTAAVQPTNATYGTPGPLSSLAFGSATDKYTDVAVDAQYQYIGPVHAFTVRANYIWEKQKLDATFANGFSDKSEANLRSYQLSASYIYDRHISLTGAYFNLQGSKDATYWGTTNGKPNSDGFSFDLAYIPYAYGGPGEWPWLNARFGVLYTHWNKFDGVSSNIDGASAPPYRNARDNDTTFLYAWIDF